MVIVQYGSLFDELGRGRGRGCCKRNPRTEPGHGVAVFQQRIRDAGHSVPVPSGAGHAQQGGKHAAHHGCGVFLRITNWLLLRSATMPKKELRLSEFRRQVMIRSMEYWKLNCMNFAYGLGDVFAVCALFIGEYIDVFWGISSTVYPSGSSSEQRIE